MLGLLQILAWTGGALLALAVFIVCWEQWRQGSRPPPPPWPGSPRATSVDVDLDALPEVPAGDRHARVSTLGATLDRMVSGPREPAPPSSSRAWIETRPMVSLAPLAEPESH
ncbi:MAG: hypothetical protein Q8K96_04945 [Rubrivivax sp.]|nr:hypothetical protein [Rubrivivax sp.]